MQELFNRFILWTRELYMSVGVAQILRRRRRNGLISQFLQIVPSSVSGAAGGTTQLQVLLMPGSTDITSRCVFSTSNAAIATVDAPTLTSISPATITQGTSASYTFTGTNIKGNETIGGLASGVSASAYSYTSTTVVCTLTATGVATTGADSVYLACNRGNSGTQTLTVNSAVSFADVAFTFLATGGGTPTVPANDTLVYDPSNSFNPYTTGQASTDGRVTWTLGGFSSLDQSRSRNNALGLCAGMIFQANDGTQATFAAIGLPAGTYSIYLAAGDDAGAMTNYITVKDGATAKLTIAGVANTANHYIDASGASVLDTTFGAPGNTQGTPVTGVTLSGGTINVLIGSSSVQSGNSGLSYIRFKQTA